MIRAGIMIAIFGQKSLHSLDLAQVGHLLERLRERNDALHFVEVVASQAIASQTAIRRMMHFVNLYRLVLYTKLVALNCYYCTLEQLDPS